MIILELLGLLIASGISFYIWKKYKDKLELKSAILYFTGIIMLIWQYIAKNILRLSGQIAQINKYINLVFWIIVAILFILILIKDYKKKN